MTRRVLLVEIGTPAELPVVTPPAPRPPSAWVPDPRPSPGLPPPTGLAAVSIADAAVLSWTPSTAGGQTIIEAAPDVAGVPGIWREVARVGGDTYTISLPGGPRWVRVRAELNGRTSVATNAVLAEPVPVGDISEFEQELRDLQDLVDAVAAQAAADAAALNVRADDLRADIDATIAEVSTLADLTDDLGTEITRVETESVARDTATVETISLLGAKNGAGTAWLLNMDTVRVAAGETMAQWRNSIQANFNAANARIDAEETARANADSAQVGRIATMEARMPSGSGSLATQASVTAEASARAAADSAQVGRIEVMEARMPSGSGGLATSASVTSVETASVNRDTALGQRIDLVEATADGAQSTATQALTAAGDAASAVTQVRSQQAGGGNLLKNSDLGMGLDGWFAGPSTGTWQRNPGFLNDYRVPPGTRAYILYAAVDNPPGIYAQTVLESVPVEGLKTYIASIYLLPYLANANIAIVYVDAAGNAVDDLGGPHVTAYNPNGNLSGYTRTAVVRSAPANAVRAIVSVWVAKASSVGIDAALWMLRPMLEEVPDGKTEPSPWAPAATGLAAVTQMLRADVSTMQASYGLSVTAGGDVAGMQLLAGGGTSAIRFLSETVGFYSSDGAFQIVDGRTITRSNGFMRVEGKPFGQNNEMVMWYGPEQSNLANCRRNNAISFETNNGLHYSIGAMFSGTISAGGYTTAIAATRYSTGAFGTNGGPIVVNASFTHSRQQLGGKQQSPNWQKNTISAGSGTTSATIELWRRIGTGSWQLVASATREGVLSIQSFPGEPDVDDVAQWNNTVSLTYTDNAGGTQNRDFEVRVIQNVYQGIVISGSAPVPPPTDSRSLGVRTSE